METIKIVKLMVALCLFFCGWLSTAAQGAGYLLGRGDVVKITIYNEPDLATEAQITNDGKITFPLIGDVQIGGLDKSAAETLIATQLRTGGFIKQPQVNL